MVDGKASLVAGEASSARPRLRQPAAAAQAPQASDGAPTAAPFALAIAGVVVTRGQLIAALQPFLPQLTDIQPFEDGERFLFVMAADPASTHPERG